MDQEAAYAVNAIGTRNIAVVSESIGAKLVYIRTDYVFNGEEERPYTEFDQASPLGVYGKSKYAGEVFVRGLHSKFFILRSSWVFGANGGNFVKTMLKLADTQAELKVVNDQRGCPTYTVDLAAFIRHVIETSNYGTYHVSNSGDSSWYEFAVTIFELSGKKVKVEPVTTKEFPRPAPHPKNSVFDHMAIRLNGFDKLPHWRNALARVLTDF